jgi:hypothetical protein
MRLCYGLSLQATAGDVTAKTCNACFCHNQLLNHVYYRAVEKLLKPVPAYDSLIHRREYLHPVAPAAITTAGPGDPAMAQKRLI